MSQVRFFSNVLVDDASVPTENFTEFSLTVAKAQVVQQFRDSSETIYHLSFAGSGAREGHEKLVQVEAKRVLNSQPRANMDGYFDAVAQEQGELVSIELPLFNTGDTNSEETLTRTGIITSVQWDVGGSAIGQTLSCIFYVCHRLHVRVGGVVAMYTDPDVEGL